MAKVQLRVQHAHPYYHQHQHQPNHHHNSSNLYGTSQQQPPMMNTNNTGQSTTTTTTTIGIPNNNNTMKYQQLQPTTQQQQLDYMYNTYVAPDNNNNNNNANTSIPITPQQNGTDHAFKVIRPVPRRAIPTTEAIQGPDLNCYQTVTSNYKRSQNSFVPYIAHSCVMVEQPKTTVTCPFMNKNATVLLNKRRKTTLRPVFAISVHLLKTYKNINTIYYAQKRKRDAMQKSNSSNTSNGTSSSMNKSIPKPQLSISQQQQQQQLFGVTNSFVQQSQQQQQQLQQQMQQQMQSYQAYPQPILYQAPFQYPPQQIMQPQPHPQYTHQSFIAQQPMINNYYVPQPIIQPTATLVQNGPIYNDGYDDEHGNYVVQINEELSNRYIVQENLGKGSFGVVVKAYDTHKGELVAVKIIKNKSQFYEQAKVEISILTDLQQKDKNKEFNIVQMKHFFEWRNHLCIVFELLSYNLYDLLKYTNFKGVSLKLIRKFGEQLLRTLYFLSRNDVNIIHCDLKPENILLKHHRKSLIKVIDFGSSCYINKKMFKYIQSRFYRSPEVLLGLSYSTTIDMWSFGCILVEMHTGLPLFDGKNERDQLFKIVQVLGMPPRWMIERSPKKDMFFKFNPATQSYVLNSPTHVPNSRSLHDIIGVNTHGPEGRRINQEGHSRTDYLQFYDLVVRILQFDPNLRSLPVDALKHPFFPQIHSSPTNEGPRMSASPESPIGQYCPTPRAIQHHQMIPQEQMFQIQQQQQQQQIYQAPPSMNHLQQQTVHHHQNTFHHQMPYYYHPNSLIDNGISTSSMINNHNSRGQT
jgi:dual specificity tyrosine-phosphorylation-regulated kinase 1